MGDFPFLTDAYGNFAYTMPNASVPLLRVSNNSVFVTVGFGRDSFWSVRTGKTSNHPRLLGGSGPLWRDPSSYSRYGHRWEGISPGKYKLGDSFSLYVQNAYINHVDLNSALSRYDNNPYYLPGSLVSIKSATGTEVDNSRVRAESKALADLASSKASMGENLAQLNQTADLFGAIADASLDVMRAYRAVRHGRLPNLHSLNVKAIRKLIRDGKLEKRVANYWLSYWFGFKPLVSDAYGLYELMLEQAKPVMLVHGRGRSQLIHAGSYQAPSVSTSAPGYRFSDSSSILHQTHITGKLDDARLLRLINRVGMLNVPSLAWDLIPFSFVIDWGVPVGELLSNLTATSGLTFVGGSSTVRYERELLCTVDPRWLYTGSQGPVSHLWGFGTNRTKLNSWPKGGLYSKPFFTGASRFATIGALMSNLLRGA